MKLGEFLKKEPVTFLFTKMWTYGKEYRPLIVLYLLMSLVSGLIALTPPYFFGKFLDIVQASGVNSGNINELFMWLSGIFFSVIATWIFHGPSRVIERNLGYKIYRNYKKYLIHGVMSLGLAWHSDHESGDTIDKIRKATDSMYGFCTRSFQVVNVLVRAVGTAVILISFNLNVSLFSIGILLIAFAILFRFDKHLIPMYRKISGMENKIEAKVFDVLSNVTTIKILNIETPVVDGISKSLWEPYPTYVTSTKLNEWKWFTGSVLFRILVLIPFGTYLWYLYRNGLAIEVGTLSALYLYLNGLDDAFFTFAGSYEDMVVNKTRVLNAETLENDIKYSVKIKKSKVKKWKDINITNLNFKYADVNTQGTQLDKLNLSFYKGEKIALIGESGSGKSTFLKVIHGMYRTSVGDLQIDKEKSIKTNFSDIDLKTTLVPQEPEVFSASIRENITLGLDFKDEIIKKATDMAEFTNVIAHLPKGLDSVINEKGVNLSGGQKQRLALSRALLFAYGKDIILLDESTSSVDPENEVKIYQNIFQSFSGKTILASIHKMNLLKYFDRIIIMDKGKIIDQGTFDQLLEKNMDFKNSWEEYVKNTVEE
jgi:ABC-type multidrug transport system fused ATPase/permease subunit